MQPLKQQGVALITVILIVALATILATAMISRQQLEIHRSTNLFNYEQAYQYVLGAEDWAGLILKRDASDNKTDSLTDSWATVLPPLPLEGGQMSGKITDLQACFNLNNLLQDSGSQKRYYTRFRKLLRLLELDESIADALRDWLDSNLETGFNGAEDNYYLGLEPPYRSADQAMQDSSELLLVKGVDYKSYQKLRPFVCALSAGTSLNLNTAPAEVIATLAGLTLAEAEGIIEDRNRQAFGEVKDFLQHPLLKNKNIDKQGLSVSSRYFQLNSEVQIGRIEVGFTSVLLRLDNGEIRLVKRSRSVL